MSFTITYANLSNGLFVSGLRKLVTSDKWRDPKKAYNCARIGSLLDQELKTFHQLRKTFFEKWKSVKPENDEAPTEEDKKRLQEMKEEADKFSEISFVIERHKIDFKDLEGIPLSPNEILALEPLLENLPS